MIDMLLESKITRSEESSPPKSSSRLCSANCSYAQASMSSSPSTCCYQTNTQTQLMPTKDVKNAFYITPRHRCDNIKYKLCQTYLKLSFIVVFRKINSIQNPLATSDILWISETKPMNTAKANNATNFIKNSKTKGVKTYPATEEDVYENVINGPVLEEQIYDFNKVFVLRISENINTKFWFSWLKLY